MTINHPIQPKEENSEEIIWCDACLQDDRRVVAKVYCQDCEKNLCGNCDMIHQFPGYEKHVRTRPKPKDSDNNRTEKCPIHQKSKLSRYCKNCQKLICSECVFDHSNHETIAFDQSMDFYKELINEQKKLTQNHFKKINEKVK
ncbi:tripartite motif-containing protein [Anaeramoeba flamelloides]|uniref:Tripartite motif-containing protein n=1 Tax=Anaeramoeba flamelloides TaxID=1746091 RepID=A0AAV7Z6N4_9EUKA|nr:tripartite motif-containing protein [Anaeramoeba flamelloides]